MGTVLIHPHDNVSVNLDDSQKYANRAIKQGEQIIKYGFPIGTAKCDIDEGEWVHSHNLKTSLSGVKDYTYTVGYTYSDYNFCLCSQKRRYRHPQ